MRVQKCWSWTNEIAVQCTYLLIMFYLCSSQEEFDPADPITPCVNYPTENYRSYADCDDQFLRRTFPPDLRPFWTTDDISEASSNYTTKPGENLDDFGYSKLTPRR